MSSVKANQPAVTVEDFFALPKGQRTFHVLDRLANEDSGGAGSSISREGLLRMDVSGRCEWRLVSYVRADDDLYYLLCECRRRGQL